MASLAEGLTSFLDTIPPGKRPQEVLDDAGRVSSADACRHFRTDAAGLASLVRRRHLPGPHKPDRSWWFDPGVSRSEAIRDLLAAGLDVDRSSPGQA
jgi:hypothetical protein